MELNIQIYSLIFSLIYGMILNVLLEWFNKFTVYNKLLVKIVLSLIFVFILSILYFIGLLRINNGYLHVYFFVSIMVGYTIVYFIRTFWFTHKRIK